MSRTNVTDEIMSLAKHDASIHALREASDRFHRILSALCARRMLESGVRLTDPMREKLSADAIDNIEIEKLSADGFEACVRMLAELGATDVTIHECTGRDLENR